MAFSDYLDLRTAVIEEVGDAGIADVFDRLTKLAEASLGRKLKTRHQITETALTVSGGVADLPSDFREVIGLYDERGCEMVQRAYQATGQLVMRDEYAIGATQVKAQDGAYTLKYYAALPSLTTGMTASNWLLANYPSVYLWAVATEAYKHKREVEQAAAAAQVLAMELADVSADDFGARYARATVTLDGVTP